MRIELHQLEMEVATWREFLNSTIGSLGFGIALACLSLPHPHIYAWVGLVFLALVGAMNPKRFPPTIRALRDKERTDAEDILFRGIQSKYLGFWSTLKTIPVFMVSWTFLALIAAEVVRP
jgi:hypothetical protein